MEALPKLLIPGFRIHDCEMCHSGDLEGSVVVFGKHHF